jgi:hypothetical protein
MRLKLTCKISFNAMLTDIILVRRSDLILVNTIFTIKQIAKLVSLPI